MRTGLHLKTPRKDGTWEWPHFSPAELACKCGGRYCDGEYYHDPEFLDELEGIRSDLGGKPLILNSGHRCSGWNRAVGGALYSQHLRIATDISLRGHDRFRMLRSARTRGFKGVGKGTTFLHLDRRKTPATWYYGPDSIEAWKK